MAEPERRPALIVSHVDITYRVKASKKMSLAEDGDDDSIVAGLFRRGRELSSRQSCGCTGPGSGRNLAGLLTGPAGVSTRPLRALPAGAAADRSTAHRSCRRQFWSLARPVGSIDVLLLDDWGMTPLD